MTQGSQKPKVLISKPFQPQEVQVFEGDGEAGVELKEQTKPAFESGLELYYGKKFSEAGVHFSQVVKKTLRTWLPESTSNDVPTTWSTAFLQTGRAWKVCPISNGFGGIPFLFIFHGNFDDTWHFALGVHYRCHPLWQVTEGVAHNISPVSDEDRTVDFHWTAYGGTLLYGFMFIVAPRS
jgi:long-subunit fatty acid transport protein